MQPSKLKFSLILRVTSLVLTLLLVVSCSKNSSEEKALLFDLIPHNTSLILEASSFQKLENSLTKNELVNANLDGLLMASIKEKFNFIQHFPTDQAGILSLSPIGSKELIPTYLTYVSEDTFAQIEANSGITFEEKITYGGVEIHHIKVGEEDFYVAIIQQVGILSPSKLMIENIIRQRKNEWESTPTLKRLQKTASSSSPTLYVNAQSMKPFYTDWFPKKSFLMLENFVGWSAFDIKTKNNTLQLVGVNLYEEGSNAKMQLLQQQSSATSTISSYIPLLAIGAETYLISDVLQLENQKEKLNYPKSDKKWWYLFDGIEEVSKVYFEDYDLISFKFTTPATFASAVEEFQQFNKSFRNHPIYELDETAFLKTFSPLVAASNHRYFTQIDKHFFFASKPEQLESLWINVEAKSVWSEKAGLQSSLKEVSNKANALMFLFAEPAKEYLAKLSAKPTAIQQVENNQFEAIVFHLKNEGDFSYASLVWKAGSEASEKSTLSHLGRIQSKYKIISQPSFFTNWRTKQRDVLYQDENFVLHLTDTKGNELWSKQLDGAIVGDIQEIDIYRNTRIQMIFATQNKVYLIDKEGNSVKPFPLDFKDLITQELSVFDYDNNGNYRFVITQGNSLLMFDKDAKTVKGFNIPKTKSSISQPLKHIRLGKKDYLMLQEENGRLQILDRTGKERIKVSADEAFSGQAWYAYDGGFVSTTKDNQLAQIDQKGTINKQEKAIESNHHVVANERLLVLLSENKLFINEVEVKLNYGLYLPPKIISYQDKSYVLVVDEQANAVYLFDEYGKLMNGFPVFGKSMAAIHFINLDEFYMITKGEENSILIYKR